MSEITNLNKYVGNELEYLRRVLCSENWSGTAGSWNHTLEQKFAEKFGAKYAVAFNSGTATLHAALEAVGVGPGDEVITPAFAPFMCTSCIIHANAIPVYVDIDIHNFLVEPAEIARKITKKTKAIIVVSLYGLCPDLEVIMKIARSHNIPVIEDNAQRFIGKLVGDIASYSFENTKHMSCGEGGIIITNNEKYAEKCRKIGGHGFKNLTASEGQIKLNQDVFQNPHYKRHSDIGWNYRLPEFNAAVALAQLERLDELVDMRIKSAELFLKAMSGCTYLEPQRITPGYTNCYYTLGVLYKGVAPWEEFRKVYIANGGDGFYGACSVSYLEPVMVERKYNNRCPWVYNTVSYREGLCPFSESIQKNMMQFKTNYRDLKLAEIKAEALAKTIKQYA